IKLSSRELGIRRLQVQVLPDAPLIIELRLTSGQAADTLPEFVKSKFSASLALLAFGVFAVGFWNPKVARAADTYVPLEGEKTTWHEGFDRYDYVMDEASFAITPFKRPDTENFAVGNPAKGERRCIVVA